MDADNIDTKVKKKRGEKMIERQQTKFETLVWTMKQSIFDFVGKNIYCLLVFSSFEQNS